MLLWQSRILTQGVLELPGSPSEFRMKKPKTGHFGDPLYQANLLACLLVLSLESSIMGAQYSSSRFFERHMSLRHDG